MLSQLISTIRPEKLTNQEMYNTRSIFSRVLIIIVVNASGNGDLNYKPDKERLEKIPH